MSSELLEGCWLRKQVEGEYGVDRGYVGWTAAER